jgi:ubiquinone/menaquinone biosynthesis C-methylase UbiE
MDVIISNCVINLVPNKLRAFQEAFRVLKPGGRLMISDMVLQKELPEFIKTSIEAYAGCIAGAIKKDEYLDAIKEAGFTQMKIIKDVVFNMNYIINFPELRFILKNNPDALELLENDSELLNNMVASIGVRAFKPL